MKMRIADNCYTHTKYYLIITKELTRVTQITKTSFAEDTPDYLGRCLKSPRAEMSPDDLSIFRKIAI